MSDQLPTETAEPNDELADIALWRWLIPAVGTCVIIAYFWFFHSLPPASNPDKWGTFGDYFGGLMNPVVAFAAFYWLTQSVKLQKAELKETRDELRKAAEAQNALVANGLVQVQLAALTALANSASEEMSIAASARSAYMTGRSATSGTQTMMYQFANQSILDRANEDMNRAKQKRDGYLAQMEAILVAHTPLTSHLEEKSGQPGSKGVSTPEQSVVPKLTPP